MTKPSGPTSVAQRRRTVSPFRPGEARDSLAILELHNDAVSVIHLNQLGHSKEQFVSSHRLHFEAADGVHVITLSGIAIIDLEASQVKRQRGSERDWVMDDLVLDLALPEGLIPEGQAFVVEQCAPFLTINAIGGISTVGWGVNEFSGPGKGPITEAVTLKATIGVFSTGEVLHRVGYQVTLTGRIC